MAEKGGEAGRAGCAAKGGKRQLVDRDDEQADQGDPQRMLVQHRDAGEDGGEEDEFDGMPAMAGMAVGMRSAWGVGRAIGLEARRTRIRGSRGAPPRRLRSTRRAGVSSSRATQTRAATRRDLRTPRRPFAAPPPVRFDRSPPCREGAGQRPPSRIPPSRAGRAVAAPRHVQPKGSPGEPIHFRRRCRPARRFPESPLPSRHPCWRRCCCRPARARRDRHRQPGHVGALGQHVRLQPRLARRVARPDDRQLDHRRRGHVQLRQGRHRAEPSRPPDRARRRLQADVRLPRQRRRLVRQRLRWHRRAAIRHWSCPICRRAVRSRRYGRPAQRRQFTSYDNNEYSPYTKRFYAARRARSSTRSCSRISTLGPCRWASRSAATPCTGANRCCSAAICTAFRIRRCRSTCRRASPRPAPKRRSCSGRSNQPVDARAAHRRTLGRRAVLLGVGVRSLSRRRHVSRPGGFPVQRSRPAARSDAGRPASAFANLARDSAAEPKQRGDWGVSARWSPEWLDGTMGFYYRNFSDKLPQVLITSLTPSAALRTPQPRLHTAWSTPTTSTCSASACRRTSPASASAPSSRTAATRRCSSQTLGNVAGRADQRRAARPGPRGDTCACAGQRARHDLEDAGVRQRQLARPSSSTRTGTRCSSGAEPVPRPRARAELPCRRAAHCDKSDGCATKDFWRPRDCFTPTWFQVFPGVDLSTPIT